MKEAGGPNLRMSSYQYRDSHHENKTVTHGLIFIVEIPYPERQSLFWDGAQLYRTKFRDNLLSKQSK